MKREEYLEIIESILFVSGKPVKIGDLKESLQIDLESIKELLTELEEKLRFSGINISYSKKGYLLVPNEKYRKYFDSFIKKKRQRFTKEALEVIAILYKEPRTKDAINKIRGVNSTRMLNQLIKKGYVRKEPFEGKLVYSLSDSLSRMISPEIQKSLEDSSLFEKKNI